MLYSLPNIFPVDILQIRAPFKKQNKTKTTPPSKTKTKQQPNPKTPKNPKVPQETYLLLVLKHTANNLDIFEVSSLM